MKKYQHVHLSMASFNLWMTLAGFGGLQGPSFLNTSTSMEVPQQLSQQLLLSKSKI